MHGFMKKDIQKNEVVHLQKHQLRRNYYVIIGMLVPNPTVKSFFRLWNEIEAMVDDFPKVSALVRSQLKFALRDEAIKQLYEFEKDMLEVEYKVIRDRKLKELELDDDLLSKPQ
ncbi:hypothetical protein RhiirB3_495042 [Rhizophagus irregularis]|nr:hypothetical protein RhiirB3_495042 [Rhizophagus irregularis]